MDTDERYPDTGVGCARAVLLSLVLWVLIGLVVAAVWQLVT